MAQIPPPRVTVVIPTYQRRTLLEEALDSVLQQEDVSFEVIVVDDGSTDDTAAFVAARQATDVRVRYHHQENAGVSAACNRGVALARAPLIAFLDSDDLFLPGNLAAQSASLDAHPEADLVLCDGRFVGGWRRREGQTLFTRPSWQDPGSLAALGTGASAARSSMMLRAETARALPFDTRLSWYEDTDFLFRLALSGRGLVLDPEVRMLVRHVPHVGAPRLSSDAPDRGVTARIEVLERYLDVAPDPAAARLFLERQRAKQRVREGRWREARPHLWAVWKRRPTELHTLRKLLHSLVARSPRSSAGDDPDP